MSSNDLDQLMSSYVVDIDASAPRGESFSVHSHLSTSGGGARRLGTCA
jgi:hypothetical protein